MKKYFIFIGVIMLLIFCVSSMSYEQQTIIPTLRSLLSNQPFYHLLSQLEVTYWGQTISVETRGYYYFVEFLIRKGFHFIGYGFIGIVFYLFYRKCQFKLATLYAVMTAFAIASLDELRQTFVDGRTGVFEDVLLDTLGAITLIFLYKIGRFIYNLLFSKKTTSKIELT